MSTPRGISFARGRKPKDAAQLGHICALAPHHNDGSSTSSEDEYWDAESPPWVLQLADELDRVHVIPASLAAPEPEPCQGYDASYTSNHTTSKAYKYYSEAGAEEYEQEDVFFDAAADSFSTPAAAPSPARAPAQGQSSTRKPRAAPRPASTTPAHAAVQDDFASVEEELCWRLDRTHLEPPRPPRQPAPEESSPAAPRTRPKPVRRPQRQWDCLPGAGQYSVVLDTETTGLPGALGDWAGARHQCLGAYDKCRIVSVAWQVLGPPPGLQPVDRGYLLVRPEGYKIPQRAIDIHGITNEMAAQDGVAMEEAMSLLMDAVRTCHVMVGHNLDFDFHIILSELYRLGFSESVEHIEQMGTYCTMRQAAFLRARLTGEPAKRPKLADALRHWAGEELGDGAHNAAHDVEACRRVYEELLRVQMA